MIETDDRTIPGRTTRKKILDSAERLFAEHGFADTSLRMITSDARVNLAAVNYHFRSKDALIQAVFARRIEPLNRKRLEMLDACEAAAAGGRLPLEEVILAFIGPVLRLRSELGAQEADFKRLMGRMYAEPADSVRQILLDQMGEVARRFTAALRRALPDLPPVELLWRAHFAVGAMVHTLAGTQHLEILSGGLCDPFDAESTIKRMVTFLAAGLRAPASAG